MHGLHELVTRVGVEPGLRALRDKLETRRRQRKEALLVVLRRTHDCDCLKRYLVRSAERKISGAYLGHHNLVASLSVQVDTAEESRLAWMSVNPAESDEIELILDVEYFFFVHCVARV